jgi:Fe-Mn family superoxide dismutase
MAITLPELPFKKAALEPHISERTIEFHYGKHHRTYVEKTNAFIKETDMKADDLETIIRKSTKDKSLTSLFNNAAQVWNHSFYWNCLKPGGGGLPSGDIGKKFIADFGDYKSFVEQFKVAAAAQFGCGWAWLVLKDDRLEIMTTANADTPIAQGIKALLTIDVWEHAYYLDYQNKRPDYITACLDHLINWDFVNSLME